MARPRYKREPVRIFADYVMVDISTGKFTDTWTYLDIEDYLWLSDINIFAVETKGVTSRTIYAKTKTEYIHRLVTHCKVGLQVDHINGNGVDNRKCNLRKVTNQVNGMNTQLNTNNTSGHVGVSYAKNIGKWEASIKVSYKKIHLGHFIEYEDAVVARKSAEVKYGFHENHGRIMTRGEQS